MHDIGKKMMKISIILLVIWGALLNSVSGHSLKSFARISNRFLTSTFAAVNICFGASTFSHVSPVNAFGPQSYELKVTGYKPVDLCNGKPPIMPGQKAMEGMFPVCIEVDADIVNTETTKTFKDVAVYGFVKEDEAGNSVLPNNPDFNTDAGQYAMIPSIKPGDSHIKYQFVAAVSVDPKKGPIPKLSFLKTKGVSFPGGDKFKPLGECEIDPRAPGCDGEEEND